MATPSTASLDDEKRSLPVNTNFSLNLRHNQTGRPSSPHTPQQQLRSNNSSFASTGSGGSSFRGEEDAIIFELGSRWLRAGFEGESLPICVVGYGPEDWRRAGDYRGWLKATINTSSSGAVKADEWTGAYELWKMDLRDVDLGLIEDKIERVFRETYNKYLLTDAGTSRLVLVIPSIMPHPLLSSILSTLFSRWRFPSITLLPSPAMAAIAAGVRSALVVDLGWAETIVTGLYEHREIAAKRSTRAMKSLLQETARMLTRLASDASPESEAVDDITVSFEYCEEVVSRFAWCKPRAGDKAAAPSELHNIQSPTENDPDSIGNRMVSIPSPSNPNSTYIDIPFSAFAEPVEKILFAKESAERDLDDEEKSIPLLVYNTLLRLPPDVRGTCMSRIIFVGGGANIPGIRRRVLDEVAAMVNTYGWSPVRGEATQKVEEKLLALRPKEPARAKGSQDDTIEPAEHSAGLDRQEKESAEEEIDFVEQKLRRSKDKEMKHQVHGVLREVESLGAWAGASLVASLKIRGQVEIEREKYLQHGLAGASRDLDHGHVPDRRSGLRAGGDGSSWTLAAWG
ncbi:actin-related protein 10 [Aspergillus udagawae]|uniref:Actin-related protein 10 n=1 Tax=Aspergillus udagawae TaxID=91492 RepID=A0ABQ1AZB4_9EURO|nr:actin-related protein 10 [Aspergillus udagawae]GFG14439.1 actin-related protein 10 [Aspergillus udagawae]GFG24422.1 actin-related protein 10 [Aspergillus udagawae]